MNSRTLEQKFGKAPLQEHNEQNWKLVFQKAVSYISNLKTKSGKNVLNSSRYASFLGIDLHTSTKIRKKSKIHVLILWLKVLLEQLCTKICLV